MCAAHELVRLDDFLNSTHAITDSGGLPLQLASMLTKPLWWAMEQLGLSSDDSSSSVSYEQRWKIARGSYVHLPALEVSSFMKLARLVSSGNGPAHPQSPSLSLAMTSLNQESSGYRGYATTRCARYTTLKLGVRPRLVPRPVRAPRVPFVCTACDRPRHQGPPTIPRSRP